MRCGRLSPAQQVPKSSGVRNASIEPSAELNGLTISQIVQDLARQGLGSETWQTVFRTGRKALIAGTHPWWTTATLLLSLCLGRTWLELAWWLLLEQYRVGFKLRFRRGLNPRHHDSSYMQAKGAAEGAASAQLPAQGREHRDGGTVMMMLVR